MAAKPVGRSPQSSAAINVVLPELDAGSVDDLVSEVTVDALEFRGLDLNGLVAARTSLIECAVVECELNAASLRGARFTDCVLDRVHATAVDVADSRWRNVLASDCRIDELDLAGAQASGISFVGCEIGRLEIGNANLDAVDISGAAVGAVVGIGNAAGLVISRSQLDDLAVVFAAELGVSVV